MAEINWTPDLTGTVPEDVSRNIAQAKADAMFDRGKLGLLPLQDAIDVLLDRIERLERSVFPLE